MIRVVTGTSTGVGKTVATAALAARAVARGQQVVVVKPVQTGIADGDSDAAEIHRLTGCAVQEYTGLDHPLAPDAAARVQGVTLPPVTEYADRIRVLDAFHDLVLVEGAGGLLVRLDDDGGTLLDLAAQTGADAVVVCAAGLGTLNHSELTVRALRERGVDVAGLVIGSWPAEPDLASRCNLGDLPHHTAAPLLARIPEGAGALDRERFTAEVDGWFG
ncbi:dethiobiotin synthase [Nocardioides sp. DS6]|uniref:ATP-dependent dethiobiotin synthetase BioD n=1 Tax=Nocardioides eburneus TaxID=3231482 RepID=A0ABV3SVA6_9ACTN